MIEPIQHLEDFQPIHDRVLVRRVMKEEMSNGGIVIPEVAQGEPLRGVVIAVGPGKPRGKPGRERFQPTEVKPGDMVMFSASVDKNYPDIIKDGSLVMMQEGDILGVLTVA